MNFIKDQIAYLKDNPEGYWFKRKLYGWGWTPARLQGWIAIVVYIVGVVYFAMKAESVAPNTLPGRETFVPIAVLTIGPLFLCYIKGEKPRWQWGKTDENK